MGIGKIFSEPRLSPPASASRLDEPPSRPWPVARHDARAGDRSLSLQTERKLQREGWASGSKGRYSDFLKTALLVLIAVALVGCQKPHHTDSDVLPISDKAGVTGDGLPAGSQPKTGLSPQHSE